MSTTSSAGFPPKTEKPKVKEDPPWLQCDFGMEKVAVTLRKCQVRTFNQDLLAFSFKIKSSEIFVYRVNVKKDNLQIK